MLESLIFNQEISIPFPYSNKTLSLKFQDKICLENTYLLKDMLKDKLKDKLKQLPVIFIFNHTNNSLDMTLLVHKQ